MKVKKNMLNKELQSKYLALKLVAFMMSKTWMVKLINKIGANNKAAEINDLNCSELYIPSRNGNHEIRLRIFKPTNQTEELPGMLYIHSGGYITGSPESYPDIFKKFIDAKPAIVICPDYRKALDKPYPAAFNDCYDSLIWLKENTELLGVISEKFILAGHSAGGGLAAAIALKARDTNDVQIAFQMLVYPMIDDRQITLSSKFNGPVWNSASNKYAWDKYLKEYKEKKLEIPPYAAPARAKDYSGLPPAISFVGNLDLFRDETIAYIENIKKVGIPVEFKLFKGCFHAFDILIPEAKISKDAWLFLLNAYSGFIEKFFDVSN